ncbi:phosphatidylinositol-3-phosphatase SAC1 [Neocloeon triangulifer]|uniref:phosphatidylinositol-3-phosphatase SAC1 n=1 Tax=Neocloeon triangulifer TaxID=2078957 RepID=UPI00286F2DF0|nr:phosphatidylinositol-3-phosphatase SAC1 [Neocloeon triangulifer]XP_059473123.1 phosphatidylinositol-3-phosphatase SAC1 [Neocloeon triangulifer]
MPSAGEVFNNYLLHISPEKIYIEPIGEKGLLVIDRVTQEVYLSHETNSIIPPSASTKPICGIIGMTKLIAGPYLIVITKKKLIGQINGQNVWQVTGADIICCTRTLLHLTEAQAAENKTLVSMIEFMLTVPYFYFSYSYDLTHTLQRLHNTTPEYLQSPLHERADPRFVWNGHMLRDFSSQPELSQFCLPLILGFISINSCNLNGKTFLWTLVSRRSCHRAGTRFFMRGIDSEGQVANFVETEQILEFQGDKCSFVQTRGSIPLYWSQLPNLKYKPSPRLSQVDNHAEAFARHFDTQIFHYGRQVLINLIDQRGAEFVLEQAYQEMVTLTSNPNIRYEAFDFHHECRKMRWERLNILIDRLAHEQDEFGQFILARDGALINQQEGVFRTNCIDCLDRTNVVQSMLARRALQYALERFGILSSGQKVEDQPAFERLFKHVWADNADAISEQYSGTKALKTDFTRTGKRTVSGALADGINSLTRYVKNNFHDGFRQDAIDLFLGNYFVEDHDKTQPAPSPLALRQRDWKYLTFPLVLASAIAMFFANFFTPFEHTTFTLLCLLFWGSMIFITAISILRYGPEYVDAPRLNSNRNRVLTID